MSTSGLSDGALRYFSEISTLKALNLNWRGNHFSPQGLSELKKRSNLKILELRIVPMGGGIVFDNTTLLDQSTPVSLNLPQDLRPKMSSELAHKHTPIDLDLLAETLQGIEIIPNYESP